MNVRLILLVWCLLWGPVALAQDARLTDQNDGFTPVERGVPVAFPQDFSAHPNHRLEWWYVTANLNSADGTAYGVQWTLFRTGLWALSDGETDTGSRQVWFAHAALTSAGIHTHDERWVRGDLGVAGVDGTTAQIDDWVFQAADGGVLKASGPGFSYDLAITRVGPAVLHGEQGYSEKASSGQASHYFSLPRIDLSGTLRIGGEDIAVTGQAWMDREWSSALLSRTQTGWDWFALTLDDARKVMLFRVRDASAAGDYFAGTVITPDNRANPLDPATIQLRELERSPFGQQSIPTKWSIGLASEGVDITVQALNPASEMPLTFPYWEGPVTISGNQTGVGYLEMTGYPR